jgi:hypothetical protein
MTHSPKLKQGVSLKKDPLDELFISEEEAMRRQKDKLPRLFFRITEKWDNLKPAKFPYLHKISRLIEISQWHDVSPKEHLWVKIEKNIYDSDMVIQLAEILKKLKQRPLPPKPKGMGIRGANL